LILIPIILLGLAILLRDPIGNALGAGEPHGFYAELFPHWLLIGFFSFFTILAFLAALVGVFRFWGAMAAADRAAGRDAPSVGVVGGAVNTLKSILTHDKFGKCTTHGSRKTAHLAAFYGFVALFIVTIWAVIDLYVNPTVFGIDSMYPFALGHPMKIVANIGCVALIFGCVKAIADRLKGGDDAGASTYFDWHFVWLLLIVGITGLITEIFRFAADPGGHAVASAGRSGLEYTAFAVYFIHLVFVFGLLVYLPYSKFAHIVYRTVALVYAGQYQKK
jgi:quinone-modifying oxidoreductase subunit QmoC